MKTRNSIVIAVVALSISTILISGYFMPVSGNTSAAPAARTGSPGDGLSCTSCHAGSATTQAGLITSDIPATGYLPGETYNITATVTMAGKTKFGFQVSPQNISGTKLGTLNLTSPTTTTLVGTGKYITHKSAGTSFPSGTATWSFTWTAPALGTGPVTFYGAFNITNSNGTSSGDIIKLSTLDVTEDPTTYVEENELSSSINIYPNPAEDQLTIVSKDILTSEPVTISIYSIDGRMMKQIQDFQMNSSLSLNELNPGYYMLKLETKSGLALKKFIKK
ncbi:MAG: T9SS type A sorting domain-containing protein [Bacteroidota bacterium]|nr:T9SS type A sorting domain-containing protein [Bacteroidota bacterium]